MVIGRLVRGSLAPFCAAAAIFAGVSSALMGTCGPFTDTAADTFCPFVLQIFYMGITTGTTATTYEPSGNVTRLQMSAFLSRTVDRVLRRANRNAALQHFWTPSDAGGLGVTTLFGSLFFCAADGADIWVSGNTPALLSRVRASDGRLLETTTGFAGGPGEPLAALGRILVPALPTHLYSVDPTQVLASPPAILASNLGNFPVLAAFDGVHVWTANQGSTPGTGSMSILTPGPVLPWSATTVTVGFSNPGGALFDGTSMWSVDFTLGTLLKLDSSGGILLTITVGSKPNFPVFDGTNIWVPNRLSNSVTVVRASSGAVLLTLTGNGLNSPVHAAFDGERVLVTNKDGNVVSLWKGADLSAINFSQTGANTAPFGACSDGVNFWIVLSSVSQLARF